MAAKKVTHTRPDFRIFILALALSASFGTAARANLITNGNLQTGNLTGWTSFATANGTIGAATVTPFDTNGDSIVTQSARFQVGEVFFSTLPEGGGIFQNITTSLLNAQVNISLDIASFNPQTASSSNSSGGIFSLLFDGAVLDTFDFADIGAQVTERSSLLGSASGVAPGLHEVRLLMTRPFLSNVGTPFQYIDDVNALESSVVSVPEPSTLILFGVGVAGLYTLRRRQMKPLTS
jgi:hypothetical protein